jgi:DNA-binding PadR family transcriptional regulator
VNKSGEQANIKKAVMEKLTEMFKGVLEGCVLECINSKETYGYEITRKLNELGFTDIVEGTVYTILMRLERDKLVNITKKRSVLGPPRKFFTLNKAGKKALAEFWEKWEFIDKTINQLKENK